MRNRNNYFLPVFVNYYRNMYVDNFTYYFASNKCF